MFRFYSCVQNTKVRSNDEVRHGDEERPEGHEDTPHGDDLRSVELGTEITDEGDHQQVAWGDRDRREEEYKHGSQGHNPKDTDFTTAIHSWPHME